MTFETWYFLLGGLMLAVAFIDRHIQRLPITTTIVYLAVGVLLGPLGLNLVRVDPIKHAGILMRLSELAVIVSLFTVGLKLNAVRRDPKWRTPIRLAFVSMLLTVGLLCVVGTTALALPLGAALILGAALAPTDPVLASDVQVEHQDDNDRLRFSFTGEAGLNDGTAFPFVMLGLGLLGLHELGQGGWRWFAFDLGWGVIGGLAIGGAMGAVVGYSATRFRMRDADAISRDEFVALGLIGFSYGAAVLLKTYGFLAVFAAALALRCTEERTLKQIADTGDTPDVAAAALRANEQLGRILEVTLVLLVGIMLSPAYLRLETLWLAPLLFLVIRPAAVWLGLLGCGEGKLQRILVSWFGIRGVGSIYYLTYAIEHQVVGETAHDLSGLILSVIAVSILLHGISVTPIMRLYERRKPFAR